VTTPATPATTVDFLPFGDDSAARRVHREGLLLLGGGRALLMQIAHPLVARGVAEHSGYRTDRVGRLLRTLRPTLAAVFGTREQAFEAVAAINRVHDGVKGPGYAASDPQLLLWVLTTLIDTSLVMYERFVGPLNGDERQAYYEDAARIGGLLGIPAEVMPADVDALQAYVAGMCETLVVSDEAREIADALFATNLLTWPIFPPLRTLTAGLLPEPLREQFGLGWGPKREATLDAFSTVSRAIVPRLPAKLKAPPWFVMPVR
jgi:uncharacterized protein (DUF2236 family)